MSISIRTAALSLLASAVLVAPSFAGVDVLKVKGKVLKGDVTAYDDTTEILTFVTTEGEELKIPAKDLDRLSGYKLAKTKVDMKDAEDLIKLGNFARTIELFVYAGRHYDSALKADPTLASKIDQERAKNRSLAAEYCMRYAREAISKRDTKEAEKWLTTLVNKLPNEPLAAEASSMLREHYTKNHEAKDDHLEAKHAEALEKELKQGKKHYDSMLKKIQQGLSNTRSTSSSRRSWEGAWKDGEKTLKELDKAEKIDDGANAELFKGYRELVIEHMVAAQLHIASSYSTSTSYNQARKAINLALSVDPNNKEALAARARVEDAASRGGILRWW